jgi:predicted enzyme related to lactoylglutathione lyase
MAHPVSFFQISAADGKPLQAFYQTVFSWKLSLGPGDPIAMVAPEKDGIPGGVGSSQDGSSNVTVYISVDDVRAHLDLVSQAGGQVVMQPMELPGGMGSIAGFTDPAGNWIGLWQSPPKKPAPARRAAVKASARRAPAKKKIPQSAKPSAAKPSAAKTRAKTSAKKGARAAAPKSAKPAKKKRGRR